MSFSTEDGEIFPKSVAYKRAIAARALLKIDDQPSTSRDANTFAMLSNLDNNNKPSIHSDNTAAKANPPGATEPTNTTIPKPPPIFLPEVINIKEMVQDLKKAVGEGGLTYKAGRDGRVRIIANDIASFRKLQNHLDEKDMYYRTYQLKSERAYRIVIKGIHSTTPCDDIIIHHPNNNHQTHPTVSYANVARGFASDETQNINNSPVGNVIITRIEGMMEKMFDQFRMLTQLLTTVLNKLCK